MTEQQRSEALAKVDERPAGDIDQPRTFCALHEDRRAADRSKRAHRTLHAARRHVQRAGKELTRDRSHRHSERTGAAGAVGDDVGRSSAAEHVPGLDAAPRRNRPGRRGRARTNPHTRRSPGRRRPASRLLRESARSDRATSGRVSPSTGPRLRSRTARSSRSHRSSTAHRSGSARGCRDAAPSRPRIETVRRSATQTWCCNS